MTKRTIARYAADHLVSVEFHSGKIWVTLADGRTVGAPLAWFPFLQTATEHQREHYTLRPSGVWWPQFDDGVSVSGLLKGNKGGQPLEAFLGLDGEPTPEPTAEPEATV